MIISDGVVERKRTGVCESRRMPGKARYRSLPGIPHNVEVDNYKLDISKSMQPVRSS